MTQLMIGAADQYLFDRAVNMALAEGYRVVPGTMYIASTFHPAGEKREDFTQYFYVVVEKNP